MENQSLCRVCLLTDSKGFALTEKTEFNTDYTFLQMFTICTHLEVFELDDLPQIICQRCSNDLQIAFEFIKKAVASDQILKTHYGAKFENITDDNKLEIDDEIDIKFDQVECSQFEELDEVDFDQDYQEIPSDILKPVKNEAYDSSSINIAKGFDEQFENFVKLEFVASENGCLEYDQVPAHESDDKVDAIIEGEQKAGKPPDSRTSPECKTYRDCKKPSSVIRNKYVECKICGKLLKQTSIKYHLKRCQKDEKIHLCSSCPKSFAVRSDLRNHMRTHDTDRERRYMCSQCGKGFYEKQSLKVHIARHMGEKEFHCPVCPKQFTTKKSLDVHMFTHNRQLGRFICKHCNKRFSSKADLIVHERFHTGDYPFQCEFCDKSFAVKSHYNYHLAKHQGVTYKCDKCDKEFLNRGSLSSHKFKHDDRMPHECPICKKGFSSPYKLNRHKSSHKSKEDDQIK